MVSTLCQNGYKKKKQFKKKKKNSTSTFCVVWTIRFCLNFTSTWYKHFLRNVWRDFRLLMSVFATVERRVLMANLQQKLIF